MNGAQEFRETVQRAEEWIANAELHAQRIPAIKTRYREIEERMQSPVATERATNNPAARGQISVTVNQLWDINIANYGAALNGDFVKWDGKCGEPGELQKRGATAQSAEAWMTACKLASAEREKFMPIFKRIMEQRNELKSFQVAAQARRKALVAESNRIE